MLEHFMQDDRFRKWVLENDDAANAYWDEFLIHFPEKQPVILSARSLLNAMKGLGQIPDEEQGARIWETINKLTEADTDWIEKDVPARSVSYLSQWVAAASVIILFCSLGWYFFNQKSKKTATTYVGQVLQTTAKLIEHTNSTHQTKYVRLPDGSTVELAPDSRISYPEGFSDSKREVFLSGRCFFSVVKNPAKPFFVYANRLIVQVVGTSFTVTSTDEKTLASVVVKSGKVKVYTSKSFQQSGGGLSEDVVVLTPNMQVSYNPVLNVLSKSIIPEPAIVSTPITYPDFLFESTSVDKVFETLEQSYGVSITYDKNSVENCSLTAPLGKESLFRKLDIICQTIGATYQVWGTEIVITGKGCKTE